MKPFKKMYFCLIYFLKVGSYVIDVTVSSLSVPSSPLIAKAYDATLIKVTDISDGVVGDLSTFRGENLE